MSVTPVTSDTVLPRHFSGTAGLAGRGRIQRLLRGPDTDPA